MFMLRISRVLALTLTGVSTVVAVFFGATVAPSHAQTAATITGQAVDASGGAVVGATVRVARADAPSTEVRTDAAGRFAIAGLAPGRYVVTVSAAGFATASQDVAVEGGITPVVVTLAVEGLTETLDVVGTRYRPLTASTGTKLDLPVLQTPQSISTVTRGLIDDRVLVRLSDVADNVAGVRALTGYTGTRSNNYQFRGFSPSLNYTNLRNGFQEYSFLSQRDVANIDRVEFLKGPASLLYGAGEVGGMVNTLTKQPLTAARREVGLTLGSFRAIRPTVDLTGPLTASGSLRYRLNAAFERGDSYRDLVNHENTFVAPHLVWQPSARTSLGIEMEVGRYRNDFDRGFPLAPEFLSEPVNKNFGEPWTSARNRQVNTMVNLSHQLSDRWRLRSGFNHIQSDTETNAAGFGFVPLGADRRTINRDNFFTDEASRNYTSQNELSGRFRTGALDHQLLVGGELTYYRFNYTFNFRTLAPIDRLDPVYGALPGFRTFGFNDDSFSRQLGVYAQDQIGLPGGKTFLQLGGRYSLIDSTTRDAVTGREKNQQNDTAFTPRAGLVYQLTSSTSTYVSLASSFQPNFFSRSRSGQAFAPTTGRQVEVGVKQSLAGERLLATVAVFDLTKRDIVVPDPDDFTFTFSIQVGEQRSRGVEVELTGALTPRWDVVAAYTGLDAEVTQDSRAAFRGGTLAGTARHSGSLYTRYTFDPPTLRGLSVGFGIYASGRRFAALPNPAWEMPAYARADLDLRYEWRQWRFNVAFKNVTNEASFELGGFGSMMPQPSRHVMAATHVRF
jgi:iron complex outermembrane receptor protein